MKKLLIERDRAVFDAGMRALVVVIIKTVDDAGLGIG